MKKIITVLALALLTSTAQANFFGSNDGEWKMGPNGPYWDESDWPEWTPMYWMEEFMDAFDDDDDNYGGYNSGFGGMPFSGGNYGYPAMPYGGGYGYPQTPYYGGGYGYSPMPGAPATPVAPVPPQP